MSELNFYLVAFVQVYDHCFGTTGTELNIADEPVLLFFTGTVFLFLTALSPVQWKTCVCACTPLLCTRTSYTVEGATKLSTQNFVKLLAKMKWSIADYFEKQIEEREEEAGEGEPSTQTPLMIKV